MKVVNGHGLLWEGRTYAQTLGSRDKCGVGRCSCGVMSPELPTTAARQRWHREHKQAVLDARTPS